MLFNVCCLTCSECPSGLCLGPPEPKKDRASSCCLLASFMINLHQLDQPERVPASTSELCPCTPSTAPLLSNHSTSTLKHKQLSAAQALAIACRELALHLAASKAAHSPTPNCLMACSSSLTLSYLACSPVLPIWPNPILPGLLHQPA